MNVNEESGQQPGNEVLRIGIVGCGVHASIAIFPALRNAPVDLVAVCDLDLSKAQYNARKYGARRYYGDAVEMMEKEDLQAILVIGPAKVHYQVAKEALQRGLHVWMEKPPGETREQAFELMRLAEKHHKQIQVGFMMRFATAHQMAKEISQRLEFGGAKALYFRYMANPYPDHLTFFLYHCIHGFDLARHFMGEPDKIFAREATVSPGHFHLQASLSFVNGSIATLDMSCLQEWTSPNVRLEVTGVGKHVIVENSAEITYYRNAPIRPSHARDQAHFVEAVARLDDRQDALTWQPNQNWATLYSYRGYEDELNAFASAILSGSRVPVNIEDGYSALKLLAAVEQSAQTGKEVSFADFEVGDR